MDGHQVPCPVKDPGRPGFFLLGILCEKMFGQAELIALHSKVVVLVVGLYRWLFLVPLTGGIGSM